MRRCVADGGNETHLRCYVCDKPAARLCDYPDCDATMCVEHATRLPPNTDYCEYHKED